MAIIDLRHLVDKEFDVIQFTGSVDKIDYEIPVKKTIGMSLMMSQYFLDYNKNLNTEIPDYQKNIELNYLMVTAWVRGYFPELSVEWVKNNICDELFRELVKLLEPLFFPKQAEPEKPRKTRKSRKS